MAKRDGRKYYQNDTEQEDIKKNQTEISDMKSIIVEIRKKKLS